MLEQKNKINDFGLEEDEELVQSDIGYLRLLGRGVERATSPSGSADEGALAVVYDFAKQRAERIANDLDHHLARDAVFSGVALGGLGLAVGGAIAHHRRR